MQVTPWQQDLALEDIRHVPAAISRWHWVTMWHVPCHNHGRDSLQVWDAREGGGKDLQHGGPSLHPQDEDGRPQFSLGDLPHLPTSLG